MISFLSVFQNRWNRSKIFLFNQNQSKTIDSSNYLRYTQTFNRQYNDLSYSNDSPLKSDSQEALTLGVSYEVFLKCSGEIITSFLSVIPYTVFCVKVDNGRAQPAMLTSKSLLYRNLYESVLKSKSDKVTLSDASGFLWLNSGANFTSYSIRKDLLFAKSQLWDGFLFKITDLLYLTIYSKIYSKSYKFLNNFRVSKYVSQASWNFYKTTQLSNISFKSSHNSLFVGLKFIWVGMRFWIVGLVISSLSFFFFIQLKGLIFNKTVFGYFIVGMFFYWLISGFVFFIKKNQYSKFTSVIQRFWKRTFIIFWMIEGSLFICFFYLVLNAPEEPLYMYDQIKIYKTHLFSWRWFLIKLLPSILLIILGFYLQMLVRWGLFFRQSPILLLITVIIVYIFWVEFYQFFHVISFYGNFFWVYDYDEFIWSLELDDRRNRIVNNSVAISLIAKFWHIVFMFIFWVFFILRANEVGRVRYALIAANNQNFILLYIISWVYMYPWFKFIFRKQLDISYYWFNLHFRKTGVRVFFIDMKLHLLGLLSRIQSLASYSKTFQSINFFYWHELDSVSALSSYRKSSISNKLINSLNLI
jgi:hypothetical protein